MYKKSNRIICMGLMLCMTSTMILGGCGQKSENSEDRNRACAV